MITTLTGASDYLRKQALQQRLATFLSQYDDTAVERLDGEDAVADRLREAVQSVPFLSERKLVILREPGKQKAFAEGLAETLQQVADGVDLIIYEPKLDKRSVYYKTLKKETDFQEFNEPDGQGLTRWVTTYVAEQGGSIDRSDAQLLVDRLGANQQLLQSELNKLLTYDAHITKQTIALLVEPTPQSTIFELIEAIFNGRLDHAFRLYKEQRALRVEPQAIIAMLTWQLHILAVVKAGGNKSIDDIAKTAKLNPFVVRKSQKLTHKHSLDEIKTFITDLLQLDVQLKSTSIDADEALQLYLLKIQK